MRVAEDVDLVWRLTAAGWRVRYEPRAIVEHEHPVRTSTTWLRRRAFYGTGAALLAARHGSAVAPVVLAPTSAAVWVLLLVGGRPGRLAALGILAVDAVRLARRLAAPDAPWDCRPGERSRAARRGRGRPVPGPVGHPAPLAPGAARAGIPAVTAAGRRGGGRGRRPGLVAAPRADRSRPVRGRPAPRGPRLRSRAVVGRGPGGRPHCAPTGPATEDLETRSRAIGRGHTWWNPHAAATMGVT